MQLKWELTCPDMYVLYVNGLANYTEKGIEFLAVFCSIGLQAITERN